MSDPSVPRRPTLSQPAPGARDMPDPRFWGDGRPRRPRVPRPSGGSLDLLRDRVSAWRADARLGVVLLVVAAVVAGVLWYRIGVAGGGSAGTARPPTPTTHETSVPGSPGTTPAVDSQGSREGVVVHVAGAVTTPGVVELAAGARVIDAIEAAGGAKPEADLDRLNLAAKVADGERVLVQTVFEAPVPADAGSGTSESGTADPAGGLLNLNTATSAQLEELPGIGPVLASAILDERERRGGFRSLNELRDVRGIGEKRFEDLRHRVTV